MKKLSKVIAFLLAILFISTSIVYFPINIEINASDVDYGDINNDGKISSSDITKLKKYLANYNYTTKTSSETIKDGVDPNGDGKVSSGDVTKLKKYLANYDYTTKNSTEVLGGGSSGSGGGETNPPASEPYTISDADKTFTLTKGATKTISLPLDKLDTTKDIVFSFDVKISSAIAGGDCPNGILTVNGKPILRDSTGKYLHIYDSVTQTPVGSGTCNGSLETDPIIYKYNGAGYYFTVYISFSVYSKTFKVFLDARTNFGGRTREFVFESFDYSNGLDIKFISNKNSSTEQNLDVKNVALGATVPSVISKTIAEREMYEPGEKTASVVQKSILCIGQSNMGGRGFLTGNLSGNPDYTNTTKFTPEVVSPISDSRIYMMNNTNQTSWVQMQEPIFVDSGKYPGASLVASFAKAYVETYDENLGIIAVPGIGGKSLGDWWPDGALYNTAVAMGREALKTTEIVAILWHQGESDANNGAYAQDFKSVIDTLCLDLGLDKDKVIIITGELFETVSGDPQRTFATGSGISIVNNALHSLETYYDKYAVVSGKDIRCNPDGIHADGPSLRLLGYRYFAQFYKLKSGKTYDFVDEYSHYVED